MLAFVIMGGLVFVAVIVVVFLYMPPNKVLKNMGNKPK